MIDLAFRAATRRTAWVPVAVGGAGGALTGIGQAVIAGMLNNAVILAGFYGAMGLVLGVVVMGVVLLSNASGGGPRRTLAVGIPLAIVVSALAALWLSRGWLLVPVVATAAVGVGVHVAVAHRSARTDVEQTRESSDRGGNRMAALLLGLLIVPGLSPYAVGMLREGLHVSCSYGTMGEAEGSWACADGIGYIFPGLAIVAISTLPVLAGLLIVLAAERRPSDIALRWLAFAPPLFVAALLAAATFGRLDPLPAGETWTGLWFRHAGMAAALALIGVACIVIANRLQHPWSRAAVVVGISLLLAASIVQPGIAAPIAASAVLLAASILHRQPALLGPDGTNPER